MKKFLALALAAIMLMSLASTFAVAEEKTTLTMWCIATESDANRPAYEKAIAAFEAAHPDIKIEWEAFENNSYKDKIKTAMADPDSLPDADDEANAENVLNLLEICHMTYYARSVSLADLMDEANTIQADNKLVSLTLEDMIDLIDLFDNDPNLTKEDLTDEMRWLADQTVDFLIENGDVFRQEFNTDLLREALND